MERSKYQERSEAIASAIRAKAEKAERRRREKALKREIRDASRELSRKNREDRLKASASSRREAKEKAKFLAEVDAFIEAQREKRRAAWRAKREKHRDADNARARKKYAANKAEFNRQRNERRKRAKDATNQYQRDYYAKHKERLKPFIFASRKKRDPIRGLATAIRRLEAGDLGLDEFINTYFDRIVQLDERVKQALGKPGDPST
jgi:hypothetical protein